MAALAAAALLTTGCPDDEPGDESPSATTGGEDTSTGGNNMAESTGDASTGDASTGGASSSGGAESSTGMATTGSTDSGETDDDTTETGADTDGSLAECVDEDIGSAMGRVVASGNTLGAGDDFDLEGCLIDNYEPDGGAGVPEGPPSDDYVVAWTAPRAGLYRISLDGSDYDTTLGVWPAACDGVAQQCNDDCNKVESATTLDSAAGQQWFIVIDGFGGETGNFVLSISEGTEECYEPEAGTTGGFGSDDGGVGFIATTE